MGVKVDLLEVEETKVLEYCVMLSLRNRLTNFRFWFGTVYGPAQHNLSEDFLQELDGICDKGSLPIVLGGDFNPMREARDKSSDHYDRNLMDKFNALIGKFQLRELARAGPCYTWTNKQSSPILAKLDRILVTTDWETRFPICLAWSLTRVGSDHSPIILDSGEHGPPDQDTSILRINGSSNQILKRWW